MNGFRKVFHSGSFLVEAILIIQSKIGFNSNSVDLVKKLYKKLNVGPWCSLASIGRSGEPFFFLKKRKVNEKGLEMRSDRSSNAMLRMCTCVFSIAENLLGPTKSKRGGFDEAI